ncbi:MAG: response regulator [Anaeromyxobacter sp.]
MPAPSGSIAGPPLERAALGRAARVLLVEDDRELREALADVLMLEGFEVEQAENGLDALLHLRSAPRPPDVVVLDLDMPLMDGREFREAQLRNPALAAVPVLVLSSHVEEGLPLGGLGKPCSPERLLARLRALITFSESRAADAGRHASP